MIRTIPLDRMHNTLKSRQIQQGGSLKDTPPHARRAAKKQRERHVIEDILFQLNAPLTNRSNKDDRKPLRRV
ncbi:hypothetical protein [Chromobacterium vaccinii]|uniref:hypothetical protein n=1 Tax=Chromobacterium vaccinii TaxID=1108595 RepID=UPI0011AB6B65|nr:hypothetical protein [Chromobacterium vaccinii]